MVQKTTTAETRVSVAADETRWPLVGIIVGSSSDWETMEHAAKTLEELGVPYEKRVVSAHRTPDLLFEYAASAEGRGIEVIIAGAGGAAHLPGMTASKTVLPVLGVPVESKALKGLDSLLSIAQMPGGIPVGTLAIGKAGAINAALLAAAILGAKHAEIREALRRFRAAQTERVLANPDPAKATVALEGAGAVVAKKQESQARRKRA
jgi:5-(carboxyamino)imidazole ribonucleotide mutase